MKKATVKISPFKLSYEMEITNAGGEKELSKTLHTIQSHHEVLCEIEGDFSIELSEMIESFFSKSDSQDIPKVVNHGPGNGNLENHYTGIKRTIEVAKSLRQKEIWTHGGLPEELKKRIIKEGFTVQQLAGETKISWN